MKRVTTSTQEILGMARVGYMLDKKRKPLFEVYVNTDNSVAIPHFHLRDPKDWDNFHSCIQITEAKYFSYAGKEDTLNLYQARLLQNFMESPVSITRYQDKFDNNWDLVCFLWDINNSNVEIDPDVKMPDYTTLSLWM